MFCYIRTQVIRIYVLIVLLVSRLVGFLLPTKARVRQTWLIGEHRGDPHKDNGYCFFRHCLDQGHDHVYFVIHHDAVNYDDFLRRSPRVLRYGSPRHLWIFAHAAVLLYTHTYRDLIFPRFFQLSSPKRKLVFLQHGVTAFKRFHPLYQKTRNNMDAILSVSDFERDIYTCQVGIEPHRVKVTGFPRFDYLEDRSTTDSTVKILYFPTWRDWIDKDNIVGSIFLTRICSLLESQRLHKLLQNQGAELLICLHGRMRMHIKHLISVDPRVTIISYGERSVQELLAAASLLVTDYSSVSWDFLYLGKPVIFYSFDRDDYLRERGSYVGLDPVLFGDGVIEEDQLLDMLDTRLSTGCQLNLEDTIARERFFKFHDRNNSRRVYLMTQDLCNE